MPVRRGVATLSSLCVQRIAQLFIEITKCINQCSVKKNEKCQKPETDNKSEKKSDEKDTQNVNETQELDDNSSPKPKSNGDATHTPENTPEKIPEITFTLPLETEEERIKKKEGELKISMKTLEV